MVAPNNFDIRSLRYIVQKANRLAERFPELQFKLLTKNEVLK